MKQILQDMQSPTDKNTLIKEAFIHTLSTKQIKYSKKQGAKQLR